MKPTPDRSICRRRRLALLLVCLMAAPALLNAQVVSLVLSNDAVLKTPSHLATDGAQLLVTGTGSDNNSHIFSVPIGGGAAAQLYNAVNPIQIAVVGPDLFWIDPNSGPVTDTQIWRAPKDGSGAATAIYTGSSSGQPIVDGSGLAADGSLLYAADEYAGTVWRLATDGSGLTQLGPARYTAGFGPEHLNTVAADQGTLYIADFGQAAYGIAPQVVSIATNGSGFTTLASDLPLGHPLAIAVGNGKIFLTDAVATNTIWQVPIGGGTPTVYVSGTPFQQLNGLAFFNGSLYVADSGAGAIYSITESTSAPPVITAFSPLIGTNGTQVVITGQNFSEVTNVTFNGLPASFGNVTATQLTATVPSGASGGYIVVSAPNGSASSANVFTLHTPNSTLVGPLYPPPLDLSFSESGSAGDGGAGRSSGKTWYFANVALANSAVVFWGPTNTGVRLSFLGGVHPFPYYSSEIMSYTAGLSTPGNGVLVWTGVTFLPGNSTPVYTRFTLRVMNMSGIGLPLADAASAGLPGNVGGALIVKPGMSYQANLKFEASYSAGSGFVPALDFYDAQTTASGTAFSSFAGGFYFENTKPTFLSSIPNQVINKGAPYAGPVYFGFNDNEVGPNYVSLWATSTNQSLVPNGAVNFTRTDYYTQRLLVYPNAGQSGKTLITVHESDGYATNSQSFLLTVNDRPTISDITDKIVNKNASAGPYAFTINDAESSPDSLVLGATSSNLTLVAVSNIVFSGTGTNRAVAITPSAGQFGTSLITITVGDGIGSTNDSFLLTVNDPPVLAQNAQLTLLQGQTATIDNSLLAAGDAESGPARLTFTVGFEGNGGPPREGALTLNGTNLVIGATFSQDDLNHGRLQYAHNGNCSTNDDFQFNVSDGDGGVTPSGGFVVYTFRIGVVQSNRPPVVMNGSASVGLGATYVGTFPATNTDCFPQTFAFRIVTNGTLGTASLIDPATGSFSYTPGPGATGTEAIAFQVNDGTQDALAPGVFTLVISNQPPTVLDTNIGTHENIPVAAAMTAQDPDLPAQTLTFRVGVPPVKGVGLFTNGMTYVYTPNPSAIGDDSFTVIGNDGLLDSPPATVHVSIRPNMDAGDVVFSDTRLKRVTLVDSSGAYAIIATNQLLSSPRGLAFESNLNLVVMDTDAGLIRIDRFTGNQTFVCSRTNFANDLLGGPFEIAVERSGMILVADGSNGVVRVNPLNGAVAPFAQGGNLAFPKGVAVDPANGNIYVADLAALFGQSSRIVRIDPVTAAQTVISSGGELTLPIGLVVANNGLIYATDPATFGGGDYDKLTCIDPSTGVQTVLVTNGLAIPLGIATASAGRLIVPNSEGSNLVCVSRSTGVVSPFGTGVPVGSPCGIAVIHSASFDHPARNPAGQFTAQVVGEPGETYPVEATTNFLDWSSAGSVTLPAIGVDIFTDTNAPAPAWRFYRLIAP